MLRTDALFTQLKKVFFIVKSILMKNQGTGGIKNQKGKDIIVYGGASFVSSLIKANLIDDYFLFVNPTAIGDGKGVFNSLESKHPMKLVEAKAFDCGIALLHYQKLGDH